MIKKQIIFFIFLLGFSFSQYSALHQTGIFSEQGEPKFGVWINASQKEEYLAGQYFKSISLDYIFPIGLEISLGYNNNAKGGSQRAKRIIMSYHYKGTEKNYSMHIGREAYEKEISFVHHYQNTSGEDLNYYCFECLLAIYQSTNVGLSWYNNKYLAIDASLIRYENSINNYQKINGGYLLLSIGKYQKINDRIIVGITYTSHLGHASSEDIFGNLEYNLKP